MTAAELHERFAILQYQARLAYAELDWEELVDTTAELSVVAQALRDAEAAPKT